MKIKVENFQSIQKAEIEVEGLTVITGPNNIGKSALARAVAGLFSNMRGDSFVRRGEKSCSVEIVLDNTDSIKWEKGKSKNNYTINGKSISKVGSSAPEELKQFKILPVSVDGKSIWPQIAKQFEQIFLLNMSPSALSSALSDVEKIQKLENASALCRKDVRSIGSRLEIKREDLEHSNKILNCFSDFDLSLYDTIKAQEKEIEEAEKKLETIRDLREGRNRAILLIDSLKKADIEIPVEDFSAYSELAELINLHKKRKEKYILKSSIQYSLRGFKLPSSEEMRKGEDKLNGVVNLNKKKIRLKKLESLFGDLESVYIPKNGDKIPEDHTQFFQKKKKLELGIRLAKEEIVKLDQELKELHEHISEGVCPLCLRESE